MRLRRGGRRDFLRMMGAISCLPWWAGMLLAFLGYLILHWAYQRFVHHLVAPVPHVVGSPFAALMPRMRESLGFAATGVAQYVLPLLFLLGALVSAIWRHKARSLVAQAQDALVRIQGMNWRQFERLLAQVFREQGYRVQETGGGGADGGIDLILHRDGERTLVQCKHWKTRQVGVAIVREMYGLLVAHGAKRVKVVTSGDFSTEACRFAHGKPIDLVGCAELARWFGHFVDEKSAEAVLSSPDPSLADPIPPCPGVVSSCAVVEPRPGRMPANPFGDARNFRIVAVHAPGERLERGEPT